jgi:hypothetical protein
MQGEQVLQGVRGVSSRWLGGSECPLNGFARPGLDLSPRVRLGVQGWLVQRLSDRATAGSYRTG